jgi:hypothetical protein
MAGDTPHESADTPQSTRHLRNAARHLRKAARHVRNAAFIQYLSHIQHLDVPGQALLREL